jgi:hypothetical protein
MKPNPLASLNHFTVPCSIVFSSVLICCHAQSNWGSGRIVAETKLVPVQGVCIVAPARQNCGVPKIRDKSRSPLESKIVVHRDLNVLLRAQIALGRLDGGVAEQEFDLLEIPAVLPAQLGAGATEVMGAEVLDPDLFR